MSDPVLPSDALAQPEESATNSAIAGEELLPGDAVAAAPEITSGDAVAMAPAAVPAAPVANQPILGNKVENVVLLYDSMLYYDYQTNDKHTVTLDKTMELYAQYFLNGAVLESFYGFEGLVAKLQAYRTINELVLYVHGEPGGFGVNYTWGDKWKPMSLVATEDFKGVAPTVTQQVVLEGCLVAGDPSKMVVLKDLFQTPRITGWNYFHVLMLWSLNLPGPVSVATIQNALPAPDNYLLPGMPHPTTFAGQIGKFDFLYEWFRYDQDSTPIGSNPNHTIFVPRGDATAIALFSEQASCMKELKDPTQVLDTNGVQDLTALCHAEDDRGLVNKLAQVTIRD